MAKTTNIPARILVGMNQEVEELRATILHNMSAIHFLLLKK